MTSNYKKGFQLGEFKKYNQNGKIKVKASKQAAKSSFLNAFNIHRDDKRGWHYHVTPGSFPYIIGGYWGEAQVRRGPGGPPGGRGPQGGPPPRGPRR